MWHHSYIVDTWQASLDHFKFCLWQIPRHFDKLSVPRNFVSIPAKPNGKSNNIFKIFLIATTLCFHDIKNLLHLGVKWLLVYNIFELILDFSAANYGLDKTFRYKSLSLDCTLFLYQLPQRGRNCLCRLIAAGVHIGQDMDLWFMYM